MEKIRTIEGHIYREAETAGIYVVNEEIYVLTQLDKVFRELPIGTEVTIIIKTKE